MEFWSIGGQAAFVIVYMMLMMLLIIAGFGFVIGTLMFIVLPVWVISLVTNRYTTLMTVLLIITTTFSLAVP